MNKKKNIPWETFSLEYLERFFNSDLENGLKEEKIKALQEKYGKNIFETEKEITIWGKIIKQFTCQFLHL